MGERQVVQGLVRFYAGIALLPEIPLTISQHPIVPFSDKNAQSASVDGLEVPKICYVLPLLSPVQSVGAGT